MSLEMLPISLREKVLLSYACIEWASAIAHLSALRQVGVAVSDEVIGQVQGELENFTSLWATVCLHEGWTPAESVRHAVGWLHNHESELTNALDELEEEVDGQKRRTTVGHYMGGTT